MERGRARARAQARRPRFDATDPGAYPGFGPYDDLLPARAAMGFRVIADLAPDAPRWATAGGRGYAETANLRPQPGRVREVRGGRREALLGRLSRACRRSSGSRSGTSPTTACS